MGFFDDLIALAKEVKEPIAEATGALDDIKNEVLQSVQQVGEEVSATSQDVQAAVDGEVKNESSESERSNSNAA